MLLVGLIRRQSVFKIAFPSLADYVNWDEGQPGWKSSIGDEECIFLGHKSRFNLKWHDHQCLYNMASFVCEYERSRPEPEPYDPSPVGRYA